MRASKCLLIGIVTKFLNHVKFIRLRSIQTMIFVHVKLRSFLITWKVLLLVCLS